MTGTSAADLPRPRPATTTLSDTPSLSSRRVLVTGARGFIGGHHPDDLTAVATPRGVDIPAGTISSGVADYLDGERR
jgi:hypothetical protein